jgi:hypothetical protein
MAPPGSSRPSLTYTEQTLEASLPAITPCLNFRYRPKATLSVAVLKVADWSSLVISRHLFAGILRPIAELRPLPEAVIQSMSVNFPGKNSRP